MSPPFIRDSTSGFWGFPTSTMDWCEENYDVTYFIAEFWNTISNVFFIIPPLVCMHHHFQKHKLHESRFNVSLFLLTMVGFGSFAFHCTLLYQSQLLDELPMIYGTCAMLYSILECNNPLNKENPVNIVILAFLSIFISFIYLVLKNPLIFLWSYGLISGSSLVLHIRACIKYNGSRKLLALSTLSYGFGFILWNIDNEFCYLVRDLRASLPILLQPLLQLHAWWHVFAGIGTYLMIMFSVHLRIRCLGFHPQLKILFYLFPCYVKSKIVGDTNEVKHKDINGNATSVKLKNRNNGSVGNFARLL